MSDCMTFPETVDEFMEFYKVVDTEQVYSNGTEYVPIFRMRQWFEHLQSVQPCTDTISRQTAIDALWQEREMLDSLMDDFLRKGMPVMRANTKIERNRIENDIFIIKQLPSAQPTLYGYQIEHLALIARVMEKEGVTPEKAVQTFVDMKRIIEMLIDEIHEKVEKAMMGVEHDSDKTTA